jgi:photosystem II stability/assembly factor-like uncharacterized protein
MKSGAGFLRSARSLGLLGLVLALAIVVGPRYSFGAFCPMLDLYSVHFFDANRGWVVGANKTICLTTDGGISWKQPTTVPPLPPTLAFYDVQFVTDVLGWAVGSAGTILRTHTGGKKWYAQLSGTTNTLRAIYMVNINRGWVVGDANTIRKTINIGNTWVAQNLGNFDGASDIYCINVLSCRVVGGSSGGSTPVKGTSTGGSIWLAADVGFPLASLLGVHFGSPQVGFAVGVGGAIFSTQDFGASWSPDNSGTTADLYSVYCVNSFTCWAVGSGGTILKGPGWIAQNSGTTATLNHVHFINANTGWAVGAAVGTTRTLLKTTNGGNSWFPL